MSEYGEKSAVMSTFKDGLVMDMNPMASKNTILSDALNATFVTMRGNELVLQNDYGNGRIEKAYLPPGYIPIGMKEYGGIIYIASYNPLTNKGLVGSFPSPERNIDSQEWSTDEKKISWENFIDSSYEEKKSCSTFIAKLDIFGDKIIHSGDKYTIYFKEGDNLDSLKYLSNYFNITEDTDTKVTKVTSPKNNTLTIKLAVVDSENNLRDITELCRRFNDAGDVIQFDINSSPVLKFNSGYFILNPTVEINEKGYASHSNEDFITERNKKAVNTYNNKISGLVYLIVELNVIQAFNVSTKAFKAGDNGEFSKYAKKYILDRVPGALIPDSTLYLILFEFNYKYNCPDGYYRNQQLEELDDKLLQENPMLGDYSSYFGNNTASNILGSYLKHSTDDKERIIDFNGTEEWKLINWTTEETAYPIYDVNTGLYSKTLYTLVALGQQSESNTIFNYYCEPAMSYSRMPQLAVLGSINLSLIGGNSINITAWRYYNDVTTNQTHLVVGLQETLPDNCAIINSYYEVFDIDEVNPDNDAEPLFTLLSQRSSYNGEYQEVYALREEDDDTALVWNHLYLMAIIVEVKEDAEDGTSTIHREVLGYRYFLGTQLFNTCFFNNSKVFAKDYMESFWNNASEHIDPNKYIFDSKEFDGETYYSNFKDEYSSIFSIPLELKTRTQKVETKNWFKKLCGAPEWSEEYKSSEELLSVFYENRRAGELTFSNSLEAPNLSLYPINNFGEISNGGYGLEEIPNILLKYADLQKNYMGQYYKNLITEILEVGNEDDLYTSEKYVSENPNTYPNANYFYTEQISENANITIKYDLQYISELYGYYLKKQIDFKYLYKPFLNVHKKGFLDPETFFPKSSQKPLLELIDPVKTGERIYSADLGGTPLIYWPAFKNPSRLNMYDYLHYALLKYFVEHEGVLGGRNLRYKLGHNNYNTGLGQMHVDTYIGPCHNLLKGAKMWDLGSGEAEYDADDATYRVPVGINVPNDYERITTVENLSSSLVFIPLSDFAWDDPVKKESHSCGGTLVFMDSYAKALGLDNQSLLTWNTVSCNPNSDYGFSTMVVGSNLYLVGTPNTKSWLKLKRGSLEVSGQVDYGVIKILLDYGEEFGWKTFSIDNLGFSPGSVQLCFRTSNEGDKWKFSSNTMRKIDLSLIEKLCMDEGLGNKNLTPADRHRFLNSPDYFLRSSLYLKILYDYLNSICILASKNEIKDMYTFDPTKILGILDYIHKINFIGSLKMVLNLERLSEQPAGKALEDFVTKLYTNTRTILDSKYKNEEANKSFGRLLSSMWFVFPKTILTTLEESLSFNLKGTEERISNFSQTPKVAILTDDNLETFLYNGHQIEPIGEESVFIKGEDGRIYPPDPNIEEYSDAVNIMYYSSKGILYYKGEIELGSETEIGGYNDVNMGPCISYVYLEGKYDRYATLKDIRAEYAGVSLNEDSTYYTPEIIPLLNLPYLRTCLINAVEKYYE